MGGQSRVSDVLAGRRAISKEQAKRLGREVQAFANGVHLMHGSNNALLTVPASVTVSGDTSRMGIREQVINSNPKPPASVLCMLH